MSVTSINVKRDGSPSPMEIREFRKRYKLTMAQAAGLIYYSESGWQEWEYGRRQMHRALWEYFCIKAEKQRKTRKRRK